MNEKSTSTLDTITGLLNTDWGSKLDQIKEKAAEIEWGTVEISVEPKSIFLLFGSLTLSAALIILLWYYLKRR